MTDRTTTRRFAFRNVRWFDDSGALLDGSLAIEDGRVCLGSEPAGATVLEASGMIVLPGMVDAHTHFREPGQAYKEGVDNASRGALAGGVVAVLDMPNTSPPVDCVEVFEQKRAIFARDCRVHWGLYLQAPVVGELPERSVAAVKVYLAKSSALPAVKAEALRSIFERHPRVAVHAEDESAFLDVPGPRAHHRARPPEAALRALEAVEAALRALPPHRRPRLVLCHASTRGEVEWLRRMKADGFDVWGETCPHYALLTDEDYVCAGPALKVNPPLRSEGDRRAIVAGLADGTLDFLSSDHAPHAPREKADEATAPSGIAGIEWMLPLALHIADRSSLSGRRLLDLISRNAARCFGFTAPSLAEGALANLAVVRRRRAGEPARRVVTRAAADPYSALGLAWQVEATFIDGRLAFRAGEFTERVPGKELYA